MKRNKAVKIAVGVVLILLLCCVTGVLLLLYSPPVQQQAARWATTWLQNRLHSTVRLARFDLDFPRRITLQEVFLTEPQGDTLLYAGSLTLDTDLWQLLDDTLPVYRITLSDTHLRLAQRDSTWNYQFIIDAFDDGKPPSGKPPGIFIAARETPVLLQDLKFEWESTAGLSYFCLKTDSLHGRLDQVRIDTLHLDFSQIADQNGRIIWRSGAPPPAVPGVFRYDNIDLQQTTLKIDRVHITPDSILATLATFQGRDAGGLEIRQASTELSLAGGQLNLDRLDLQANDSRVTGGISLDIGDTLRYRIDRLEGRLQSADLTYFADLPFFKKNPGETFILFLTGSGSVDELDIRRFDFQTKNGTTTLSLHGRVTNLRDMQTLGGDVTLNRMRTNVGTLQSLAPGLELPEGLSRSDVVELQGRFRGNLRQLDLELVPRYQPADRGLPLTANLNATVFNAGQARLISWKVRV
ncbi:MAG TPA: hypothetical protein PK228_10955, partial [Saprospiraceae bacterium]|nr:hypothetical protein [Saprospiraceae bacterium]